MREIEVKLRAKDLNTIKEKLITLNCQLSEPITQHDVIYSKKGDTDAWTSAKTGDVVLRVRRENNKKATFNLKQQISSELDNTELESEISDPEAIHDILTILGFEAQVEVKKTRQKGQFNGYEICLDTVDGLGNFVELEKLTDEKLDPKIVKEDLLKTLETLGLSRKDEEIKGYDTQIFQLKQQE